MDWSGKCRSGIFPRVSVGRVCVQSGKCPVTTIGLDGFDKKIAHIFPPRLRDLLTKLVNFIFHNTYPDEWRYLSLRPEKKNYEMWPYLPFCQGFTTLFLIIVLVARIK